MRARWVTPQSSPRNSKPSGDGLASPSRLRFAGAGGGLDGRSNGGGVDGIDIDGPVIAADGEVWAGVVGLRGGGVAARGPGSVRWPRSVASAIEA